MPNTKETFNSGSKSTFLFFLPSPRSRGVECESAALQPHPCTLRPRGAPHPKRAPRSTLRRPPQPAPQRRPVHTRPAKPLELHGLPGGSPSQPQDRRGTGGQARGWGNPLSGLGIHWRQQLLPRSGRSSSGGARR